jgi:hypothetical protein
MKYLMVNKSYINALLEAKKKKEEKKTSTGYLSRLIRKACARIKVAKTSLELTDN